jgi:hypothetical protein
MGDIWMEWEITARVRKRLNIGHKLSQHAMAYFSRHLSFKSGTVIRKGFVNVRFADDGTKSTLLRKHFVPVQKRPNTQVASVNVLSQAQRKVRDDSRGGRDSWRTSGGGNGSRRTGANETPVTPDISFEQNIGVNILSMYQAVLGEKVIPMAETRARGISTFRRLTKESFLVQRLEFKQGAITENKVLPRDTIDIIIHGQPRIKVGDKVRLKHMTRAMDTFLIT